MNVGDHVEVVRDGNVGLTLVGEQGVIVGPGEGGYEWTVRFTYGTMCFDMWFNSDELRIVEGI